MGISKVHISSPLEAGPSLLDIKQLPPQLLSALDYVSARLARKRLHISLIVVRKDINIPGIPLAESSKPATPQATSPAKSLFSITRSLSKSASFTSDSASTVSDGSRSPSAASSVSSSSSIPSPVTPTTPNAFGLSLIHMSTLSVKAEKLLRQTIAKAEKKFPIGTGWLSTQSLTDAITCPATNDLIRRSLTQNEVLFSSEGLTLLSLDHVYTFKCHLHTYSRTLSRNDLTSAVDELRRLVLAHGGHRITKGYLMRAYDWLGVSLAALVDVNEGYKTAYGGAGRTGGIEVISEERASPLPARKSLSPLRTDFNTSELRKLRLTVAFADESGTDTSSGTTSEPEEDSSSLVDVGESAKGRDAGVDGMRPDCGPHFRGPATPNGFEDITPVTKGEWCFLMVGEGWMQAKTAAVVTC